MTKAIFGGKDPKYCLVGDLHGSFGCALEAMDAANRHGVKTLIQLGDWGFLWPKQDQTAKLAEQLAKRGQKMLFLDGNHDMHNELAEREQLGTLPPELIYLTRGSVRPMANGVWVGAFGGAASIDMDNRQIGRDWWPEEMPDRDIAWGMPRCDILLTHDSPILPPGLPDWPGLRPRVRALLDASRDSVKIATEVSCAKKLFHGHYHRPHRGRLDHAGGSCEIIGLSNNGRTGSLMLVDENFDAV